MRVALISDLHGNEVALRAALDGIARAGADRIVCLGDTATLGPHPEAVLAILREIGCACITGNHDAFLLDPELIRTYTEVPVVVDAVDWCRSRLSASELDFVRTFQESLTISLDGGDALFLFHGSPRSNMEDILATTPPEVVDQQLDGHRATVMAGGHTHLQMLRQHRGVLLVNPGSVGLPFREYASGGPPTLMPGHAEFAIVEGRGGEVSVTLHRVPVDREALRRAVANSDNPLAESLRQQYGVS